jgi:hypothetical protein
MIPGPLNLPTIWRGCDWLPVILKWKDANGNPFDLTGWTPFAETRSGISLNPVVIDVAGGITMIQLYKTTTELMKLGVEEWDWVWWQNAPSGTKYPPILSGKIPVMEPTTHDFQMIT